MAQQADHNQAGKKQSQTLKKVLLYIKKYWLILILSL